MSDKKEITVQFEVDGHQVKLTPTIVQNYIVGTNAKITMAEFKFFSELCKVRGLNPFLKEAYCIKYGNEPAAVVVGKDAILKRALKHPQYDGMKSGIIVLTEKGDMQQRDGMFYLPNEEVVGGWAEVWRKDLKYPKYVSVSYGECVKKKQDGKPNKFWNTSPATMLEKVAKCRALREMFVEELGGMYEAEEIGDNLPTGDIIEGDFNEYVDEPPVMVDDMPPKDLADV